MLGGSSDGYTLSAPQFEHRLYVLAIEGCLDGYLVGQVSIDDARHSFVDMSEFEVGIAHLAHIDNAHRHHLRLLAYDLQYAVAHDVASGVDAHYDFLHLHLLSIKIRIARQFVAYRGLEAVAWIDLGGVRQLGEHAE